MALLTMIALNVMRRRFVLHEFVLGDDGCIRAPLVRAVHFDVPLGQAIHHLLQGGFVTAPTFPVQQLGRQAWRQLF